VRRTITGISNLHDAFNWSADQARMRIDDIFNEPAFWGMWAAWTAALLAYWLL